MGPVAMHSSLRRKPEPRCRPLVDGEMTLDSGLRRNDVQGIMLCLDIFEHRLLAKSTGVGVLLAHVVVILQRRPLNHIIQIFSQQISLFDQTIGGCPDSVQEFLPGRVPFF